MPRLKSPYNASFTAASMMYYEMNSVIPLFLKDSSKETIKKIEDDSSILQIQSLTSRKRVSNELLKRFKSVDEAFWNRYLLLEEKEQRLALFYVLLKTYKLLFDFQINVTLKKYYSADTFISSDDLLMELYDIAAEDELVDSWTTATKKKIVSVFQVILRQTGFISATSKELRRLDIPIDAFRWYFQGGEQWFLEACLLPTYEIEKIKNAR